MKNTFWVLLSALLLCAVAAQSQQTPQQMVRMNVGSVQGVAPGYNSTAGSGLSLNLSAGTVFCSGAIQSYAGGTLTMAPSTTNYVYLDPSANCAPATNATGLTAGLIPIATVTTGSAAITGVTDNRTVFTSGGSGVGTCAANRFVTSVNPGLPTCIQPTFANLAGTTVPAQLPSATAGAQGAIQLAGDLSNTAAAPKVAGILGIPVSSTAPTNGQVHQFNAGLNQWVPATLPSSATFQVNGTNTASQATVNLQSGNNITVTNPSAGNVSIALSGVLPSGMLPTATAGAPGAIQLTGDLGGTAGTPKVTWLQGYALSANAPSNGQCLVYSGSSWAPGSCGGSGTGLPSSWVTNSSTNAVTAQPMSGQDAVALTLAPNVASPTADLFDICSTSPCSSGTKYVWVNASGSLNFLGNNVTYGSTSQATQSFLKLYGSTTSSNLAPPYFDLEKTDGSIKSYLAPSTTLNGVVGVSSAIPGSDIQAPAGALSGTISGGAGSGPVIVVANSAAGTTNGLLAKLTGSGALPTVSTAGISDTAIPVYPVVTGGGASGNAALSVTGVAQCTFDGATTINHFVQASTTVAGDCHDAGAAPTSGWVIGQVMSTNAAGGTYNVQVGPPGYNAASGTRSVNPQAGNYTATSTDCGNAIAFAISSNATLTLPQAGTSSMNAGCAITVSNQKAGGILTIATTTSTIGGVVHKFLGLGGSTTLVSDGTNWSYFGSDYQVLCNPVYSANVTDLLSADASGNTHYFGQGASTQATILTAFASSSCTLPANLLGSGTVLQANSDVWLLGSVTGPNLIVGLKLGPTALTNITGGAPFQSTGNSSTLIYRIFGTGAPGPSVVVDANCNEQRLLAPNMCQNTTLPNNTFPTNGPLTLTDNALWSAPTAGNSIWLKQWQVVMLNGPTN